MARPEPAGSGALLCPSARAEPGRSVVFGVADGNGGSPRVAYLAEPVPVPPDIAERTAPASPNEVLRTASPCALSQCRHFSGAHCTLVERITEALAPVVSHPPACAIRASCRWWAERGREACVRCPQVVTESQAPSDAYRWAMEPPAAEVASAA